MPANEHTELPILTDRFEAALVYALEKHRHQLRKSTQIPYMSHVLQVAGIVIEHGGSEDEAIAALLHDVIEDQGGAGIRDEIEGRFGAAVLRIVAACSDTDTIPKPPWRERKERHLAHLRLADPPVLLVSAADKLHNGRSIVADHAVEGERLWERFNAVKNDIGWYYFEFRNVVRGRVDQRLYSELNQVVRRVKEITGYDPTPPKEAKPPRPGRRARPNRRARPATS